MHHAEAAHAADHFGQMHAVADFDAEANDGDVVVAVQVQVITAFIDAHQIGKTTVASALLAPSAG